MIGANLGQLAGGLGAAAFVKCFVPDTPVLIAAADLPAAAGTTIARAETTIAADAPIGALWYAAIGTLTITVGWFATITQEMDRSRNPKRKSKTGDLRDRFFADFGGDNEDDRWMFA